MVDQYERECLTRHAHIRREIKSKNLNGSLVQWYKYFNAVINWHSKMKSTVIPSEVEKFGKLAEDWWNPNGGLKGTN